MIGERGITLSGGQRQRLAIARALVMEPRILILDDATASVDATTEAKIRLGLREAMKGRTTIIIAHRLSTISLADELVVLDGGRVVGRGTDEELLQTNAVYREIHEHGLLEREFAERVEARADESLAARRAPHAAARRAGDRRLVVGAHRPASQDARDAHAAVQASNGARARLPARRHRHGARAALLAKLAIDDGIRQEDLHALTIDRRAVRRRRRR